MKIFVVCFSFVFEKFLLFSFQFNPVRSENPSSNGHRNSNDSDPSEYDEPIADIRPSDHQEKDDENDEHDDDDSLRQDQRRKTSF